MKEYILDLLPTNFSRLACVITVTSCIVVYYFLNDLISLMPYTLEANKVLTKILILVVIFAIGLFITLCHMIKEHNRLIDEIKDLNFNNSISNPVRINYR